VETYREASSLRTYAKLDPKQSTAALRGPRGRRISARKRLDGARVTQGTRLGGARVVTWCVWGAAPSKSGRCRGEAGADGVPRRGEEQGTARRG